MSLTFSRTFPLIFSQAVRKRTPRDLDTKKNNSQFFTRGKKKQKDRNTCSSEYLQSLPKTSATMVHLTAPDHAKAVNLARRFTAQNENDLMRKSTDQIPIFSSHTSVFSSYDSLSFLQRRVFLVSHVVGHNQNTLAPPNNFHLYRRRRGTCSKAWEARSRECRQPCQAIHSSERERPHA